MKLSIIVIFHNMQREAARTLYTLSAAYQRDVDAEEYEVIAIDNGSTKPLSEASVRAFGPNFRYNFHDTKAVSPVVAMNLGAEMAQGENIAMIVDGARMASPGLVSSSLRALGLFPDPFVAALSWHLGPDVQNNSMLDGYDQQTEDSLLDSIAWQTDGYTLFEVATLAQSSQPGFLGGVPPECSWLCLRRTTFSQLGGYDTRFVSGGGGLVNHDFRNRAVAHPGIQPVVLLGEGVFHQFHGGVATNVALAAHPIHDFKREYAAIRGQPFSPLPTGTVQYLGVLPKSARRFVSAG